MITSDAAGIVARTIDTALGRWAHLEWRPPHLRPWIESLWLFHGVLALRRERTFPDGNIDLILQLQGAYRPGDDPAAGPFPTASVNGVLLGPHVVESPTGGARVLGISLHAAGAHTVLGGAVPHLTGVTVDLLDVLGADADALAGRCREATNEGALILAADFIQRRIARAPDTDRAVMWAAERIAATAGRASIGRLAEMTGVSRSTLTRRFHDRIGITPKRLARVLRFRRVLDALHADPAHPLSTLALDAGYYDQSHMNADFRALSGLTPTEYSASIRYPGSASLAEAV